MFHGMGSIVLPVCKCVLAGFSVVFLYHGALWLPSQAWTNGVVGATWFIDTDAQTFWLRCEIE